MPETIDHVAFLAQEIGPRPAGTEEEQQAALYITEQMQKEAGLSAVIEDFNSPSNADIPWAICCTITFICALVPLFLPVAAIPAIVLSFIAALLLVMEITGKSLITRIFSRGVSQNVVGKYEPPLLSGSSNSSRRRKIVLVARYDSGKVNPELNNFVARFLPYVQWAIIVTMVLVPFLLLVRNVFFLQAGTTLTLFFNVLTIIMLVIVALPLIEALIHKLSAYNEGANSNASGVAILLDIAQRIGQGSSGMPGEGFTQGDVMVHGEQAAYDGGFVPKGAELQYEAVPGKPESPAQTAQERLANAKAAAAALSGKPVPDRSYDIAGNLVQVKDIPVGPSTPEEAQVLRQETREALTTEFVDILDKEEEKVSRKEDFTPYQEEPTTAPSYEAEEKEGMPAPSSQEGMPAPSFSAVSSEPSAVPDWFTRGQELAKKPEDEKPVEVQRSRYAEALDAAVSESATYFEQANSATIERRKEQIEKMCEDIREVKAPRIADREPLEESLEVTEEKEEEAEPKVIPSEIPQVTATPSYMPEAPSGATERFAPTRIQQDEAVVDHFSFVQAAEAEVQLRGSSATELTSEEEISEEQPSSKQPIVLPDIGVTAANVKPVTEQIKQRAPLAQAEDSGQDTAKSLLNMLPSIDLQEGTATSEKEGAQPEDEEKATSPKVGLKETLPSLSGAIPRNDQKSSSASLAGTGSVHTASSFAAASATGAFAPVGDELIEDVAIEELYVEDADDSVFEEEFTKTGAFAGPGYVDMPKSRVRRIFDKFGFGKKKDEELSSAQEWLDVDEEFDAHEVGAARGNWESFNHEHSDKSHKESDDDTEVFSDEDDESRWQGGAASSRRVSVSADMSHEAFDESASFARDPNSTQEELRHIQQFRYSGIDTEVWFVALGSELAGNAGMKAFLYEHEQDLHGSIIINLDAMGAGNLSYLEKEGMFKKVFASSRMKRYIKKASQATGVQVDASSIMWKESPATLALRKGFQAMSLVGMDGNKPAYYAQKDDILENIEEETLKDNSDFVMELLKGI